jgi:osmotically inducible lipoprotein OsmB
MGMTPTMRKFIPAVSLGLAGAFALTSCETPGQSALAGAATGAAIGAVAGGRRSDVIRGAAIGAGAGYVAGRVSQSRRDRYYDDDRYHYRRSRYDDDDRYYRSRSYDRRVYYDDRPVRRVYYY